MSCIAHHKPWHWWISGSGTRNSVARRCSQAWHICNILAYMWHNKKPIQIYTNIFIFISLVQARARAQASTNASKPMDNVCECVCANDRKCAWHHVCVCVCMCGRVCSRMHGQAVKAVSISVQPSFVACEYRCYRVKRSHWSKLRQWSGQII